MSKRAKGNRLPYTATAGTVFVPERLRHLDRLALHAVLATDSRGQPYASLVTFALLPDLTGVLFATPKETFKYQNIRGNPRVALLIDNRTNSKKDLVKAEVITLIGRARIIRRGSRRTELGKILIQKHPDLSGFIGSPSTALVFVEIDRSFHVSRFQTVSRWDAEKPA